MKNTLFRVYSHLKSIKKIKLEVESVKFDFIVMLKRSPIFELDLFIVKNFELYILKK